MVGGREILSLRHRPSNAKLARVDPNTTATNSSRCLPLSDMKCYFWLIRAAEQEHRWEPQHRWLGASVCGRDSRRCQAGTMSLNFEVWRSALWVWIFFNYVHSKYYLNNCRLKLGFTRESCANKKDNPSAPNYLLHICVDTHVRKHVLVYK
jgi:hypothetical protein